LFYLNLLAGRGVSLINIHTKEKKKVCIAQIKSFLFTSKAKLETKYYYHKRENTRECLCVFVWHKFWQQKKCHDSISGLKQMNAVRGRRYRVHIYLSLLFIHTFVVTHGLYF